MKQNSEKRTSALCQASLINYLVKEIGALCKFRPQGMLCPMYPEISCEGLGIDGEGRGGQHTIPSIVIKQTDEAKMKPFHMKCKLVHFQTDVHGNTSHKGLLDSVVK